MSYVIGIDFGTASARALLYNLKTNKESAVAVKEYKHGVMDHTLPDGTKLKEDWALQHPTDYLEAMTDTIRTIMDEENVNPHHVIGIGIDFTASTILPLNAAGEPLCLDNEHAHNPHSWVKLWKHHAAQEEADQITQLAKNREETFLKRYGGKISSEWMLPKILQMLKEAPHLFKRTDLFMEAGDWLVYQLTGELIRSSNTAGYKGLWNKSEGYPSKDFLSELHPQLKDIYDTKLRGEVRTIGKKAGALSVQMAERLGLVAGTAVAVNVIDAHAAVPAVGAVKPGQMVLAMGTSTCHMLLSENENLVEGVCGTVADGILPGFISYETGQVAVGDSFAWFVEQAISADVVIAAKNEGINIHTWLEKEANKQVPGEHGLMALDWWNGNRSILVDAHLSGAIIGLTLATKPADIYRSLLESTAYGTRIIVETFQNNQVPVTALFACGGLPKKNKLFMQIYADVLNRDIYLADSEEVTALGAAMFGATAAGKKAGGFDTIYNAAEEMARVNTEPIRPIPENVAKYETLFQLYKEMHEHFGRSHKEWMYQLRSIKSTV
ncbi:L-ribulokinase [Alkalihalobacillus xiaoxiensis]|uniref:Ribulokinase n=1 Tax=Shouchella xiaoxiensis TaxID=766895 RepID=A0ABS2SZJ1_9BACI|nr:ribulokinase [Shouchella xiaoxiensis]MBM7840938.1 L-ribulokinase [Shouchella xiaoxiensis]